MKTETNPPVETPEINNSLLRTLAMIDEGVPLSRASDLLADGLEAVDVLGGKMKLTIELTVEAAAGLKGSPKLAALEVKLKKPTEKPVKSVFYVSDQGTLVREDPKQLKLPLREVKVERGPVVDIAEGAVIDALKREVQRELQEAGATVRVSVGGTPK